MPACGLTLGRIIVTLWLLVETAAASSSVKPPRLSVCREIMKAKDSSEVFLVSNSFSCQNITFPCSAPVFPDTRNCENYYKCDSLTITQCPCDLGETFNVATQRCDKSAAACECSGPAMATESAVSGNTTQTSTVVVPTATTIAGPAATTPRSTTVADAAANGRASAGPSTATAAMNGGGAAVPADVGQQRTAPVVEAQLPAGGAASAAPAASTAAGTSAASQRPGDVAKTAPPLQSSADATMADARSETSIIIAAIVCGSGVTVAVIGTVVYLCHTSRFRLRKDAKLPGLPCGEAGGYTQPGVERHLYHEIDDRTMGSSRSFIYRAQPQLQPPPLPTTQPPALARPCVLCLDSSGDSAVPVPSVGSATATAGAAKKHFPATNPHYRLGVGGGNTTELHYGSASAFVAVGQQQRSHSRESSSDCSLYSGGSASNQSTLESFTDSSGGSRGGDMRAPLNAQLTAAKSAYVSKQVYI